MCRDWVVNNGEYEDKNKFYTSFMVGNQKPDFADPIIDKLVLPANNIIKRLDTNIQKVDFTPHNHFGGENILVGCLYLSSGESSIFQNPLLPSEHESGRTWYCALLASCIISL